MNKEKRKAGRPFQEEHIDSNINFRIKKETLDEFKEICSVQKIKYSDLLRKFIEEYNNNNRKILQDKELN